MKRQDAKRRRSQKKKRVVDHSVAEECMEYRKQFSEFVCETCEFLRKHPPAREWIEVRKAAQFTLRTEVHHIFRRGKAPELGWFCCLVLICPACHGYGHDVNESHLKLCSLMAKIERHKRHEELQLIGLEPAETPPERLHKNVSAWNKVCGSPTLIGRIEALLLPKIDGTVFESMCCDLLKEISR
jgi:hypothetical protein